MNLISSSEASHKKAKKKRITVVYREIWPHFLRHQRKLLLFCCCSHSHKQMRRYFSLGYVEKLQDNCQQATNVNKEQQ